jgi:hypothetical protein
MQGTLYILYASPSATARKVQLDRPVTQEEIQDAVGGSIGFITNFDTISQDGKVSLCYAFCDEEARSRNRPLNRVATTLWSQALVRRFGCGQAELPEVLLGSVALITGDSEFMEAL